MIILRRLHLASPLSTAELHARLDAAIGRSESSVLDPSWSGDIDTPLVGKLKAFSFKAQRRPRSGYTIIDGLIRDNVLDVEIGLSKWSAIAILFPPAAIAMFFAVRYDLRKIEETLREIANATR